MKNTIIKKFCLFFSLAFIVLTGCTKDDNNATSALGTVTAYPAYNLTQTSFTTKWVRVYRAQKYQVDVALDEQFTSILPDYNAKEVADLTLEVTGLTKNTKYYYRVRALRESEISGNSNIILTETLGDGTEPAVTLKSKVNGAFFVGVAVNSFNLTGMYNSVITSEFSSITAENEMKMQNIFTAPGVYNWTQLDLLLNYAQANNLNVHGHTLIWHSSIPQWLSNYSGTNAEFEQIVHDYVTAVVTHCAGKVKSWDVVNEAISDSGTYRNSIFRQKIGTDYITKCFQWARDADPNALLFYNDYNTSSDITKQNAVYGLVDVLNTNNLIDGVGIQMHVNYDFPTKSQISVDTNRIVEKGLKVHYSEVDVRVNSNEGQLITTLTPERDLAQKLKYKEIVEVFNAIPTANKYAITMWGVKDNDSWILSLYNRVDWPLLFDNNFAPKKAHTGFLEGLD